MCSLIFQVTSDSSCFLPAGLQFYVTGNVHDNTDEIQKDSLLSIIKFSLIKTSNQSRTKPDFAL